MDYPVNVVWAASKTAINGWQHGIVISIVQHVNEITLRQAWLVLG